MSKKQYMVKFINKGRLQQAEMSRILGGSEARPCGKQGMHYLVECITLHGSCKPQFVWCSDINDPQHKGFFCNPFKGDIECDDSYRPIHP